MKIAIVGSRNWNDFQAINHFIASLPHDTLIVSGGARGVDSIAEACAVHHGLDVLVFEADWNQYGKSAGMIRNADIVKASDIVVAFWDGVSKGTANTIERASNAKKPVYIYPELPEVE